MSMKNSLTPAGIELATFRFVAQHFKHCAAGGPPRTEIYLSQIQICNRERRDRCQGMKTNGGGGDTR